MSGPSSELHEERVTSAAERAQRGQRSGSAAAEATPQSRSGGTDAEQTEQVSDGEGAQRLQGGRGTSTPPSIATATGRANPTAEPWVRGSMATGAERSRVKGDSSRLPGRRGVASHLIHGQAKAYDAKLRSEP